MTHIEWKQKYGKMQDIADRTSRMINDRARLACSDAGLDPQLLGIHPHNAMVDLSAGHPWNGIDYSKVRLCIRLLDKQFVPYRILDRWDRRNR